MPFFVWLEHSSFPQWVHGSESVFAFPTFLTIHVIGMGLLVGVATIVNLRLLGFMPGVPLAPLEKLFPLMWIAFGVNAITGAALFAAEATAKVATPVFYIKLVFVALGMISLQAIRRQMFQDPAANTISVSSRAKRLAVTSLVLWTGAIISARLIAYLQPRHEAWLYRFLGIHV